MDWIKYLAPCTLERFSVSRVPIREGIAPLNEKALPHKRFAVWRCRT